MPWPVHPTGFFGAGGDSDTYRIERSLRFNSDDSAYLNRTLTTATDQDVFTLSLWVKLGVLGTTRNIFGVSTNHSFGFTSGNALNLTFAGASALTTTALFRDPSAWYHIVWTQNSNAHTIYVNGVSIATATATSNAFNTSVAHQLGAANTSNYFNGYLAEVRFIDGQALTPSSFGETDPITGRWKAKAYSGTYGTNGFYLSFKDNTSTTTLGYDDAGSNDWTLNNFSVTAGAGNDSLVDSPTNYGTDTGVGGEVRGNYCTLNPLDTSSNITLANGNLDHSQGAVTGICKSTIGMSSGKWYWEVEVTATSPMIGIANSSASPTINYLGADSNSWSYDSVAGLKYTNNASSSYGASFTTNDVIGVAFDADNGTIVFHKNNVSQGTAFTGLTSGPYFPAVSRNIGSPSTSFNFGQRPFAYTAPTGFKALCTTNLPQPTIQKPSKYMDVVTYTGTGASNSISSFGFSPDLVWIKNRGGATDHAVYDTTRGTQLQLSTNSTAAEVTSSTGLTAFGSNGFTIGTSSLVNTSGTQYVAWAWDAGESSSTNTDGSITSTVSVNAQAGISIVSWTCDTSTNNRVGHGLGVTPDVVLYKERGDVSSWWWTTTKIDGSFDYLLLQSTAAKANMSGSFTAPTSTTFSNFGSWGGSTMIAYCFAEVEGFSKFGSYTGNGSADGPFVWCGFRPSVVIAKSTGGAGNWTILDYQREGYNVDNDPLFPNLSNAEGTTDLADFLSNGFKIRTTSASFNTSGSGYIFSAWSESPFKYARAR